jgi:hypothetical protein
MLIDLRKALYAKERASRVMPIIGGILYAAVRMMLLALSLANIRYVPEDLYITWTSLLPSIS